MAGCGPVLFVDPDQALKDRLVLRQAERLVVRGDPRDYFFFRLGTAERLAEVELDVVGPRGVHGLPLEQVETQACGAAELCLSLTLPPGLPPGLDSAVLALPAIGHQHRLRLETVELSGYELTVEAEDANQAVRVRLADPIRARFITPEPTEVLDGDERVPGPAVLLFPRRFEVAPLPGVCQSAAGPKDSAWIDLPSNPGKIPAGFDNSPDPHACVSVRPELPPAGSAVAFGSARSRALVSRFNHLYSPVVEVSPFAFLPIFDLELPTEARCNGAQDLLRSSLADVAASIGAREAQGGEILALEPVQVAVSAGVRCRQENERSFSAQAVADEVHARLDARFGPDRRIRVLVVYATNLELPLPPSLLSALAELRVLLEARTRRSSFFLAFATSAAAANLVVDAALPWVSTDEPGFRAVLAQVLSGAWPFRTVVHTDATVVPLVHEDEAQRFLAYRICSSTAPVAPVGPVEPDRTVVTAPLEGPGYRVSLPPQVLAPSTGFAVPSVGVEWEGCEGLCAHEAPGGDPGVPWDRSPQCR